MFASEHDLLLATILLIFAAGMAAVVIEGGSGDILALVSTPAIETFGMNLLAGRHLILAGSKHEILQEQDHYRGQFWAAFDAFVPGTPLF